MRSLADVVEQPRQDRPACTQTLGSHEDSMTARFSLPLFVALLAGATVFTAARAQETAPPPQSVPAPPPETRQGSAPPPTGLLIDRAWSMLTSHAAAGASPHQRIEAMAALGTMGKD